MDSKKIIWIGMFIGSTVGSYIPSLWGAGVFSFSSLLFATLGGFVGIWFGFRIGQ